MISLNNLSIILQNRLYSSKLNLGRILSGRGSANRLASFPFISGDTFRSVANFHLEAGSSLSVLADQIMANASPGSVLFCEVGRLRDLVNLAAQNDIQKVTIIVHNGDIISEELISELRPLVNKIFCVNWLGSRRVAEPIPIGIENVRWNINGRLDEYIQYYPAKLFLNISRERPTTCFQAFNVKTNPEERGHVAQIFSDIENSVTYARRISRSQFLAQLNASKFVVSPPGNGPDCHRTWEAMYAGAVPIVLLKSWPFAHLKLPVLAVRGWAEASAMLSEDPGGLYADIWANSDTTKLYFPSYSKEF